MDDVVNSALDSRERQGDSLPIPVDPVSTYFCGQLEKLQATMTAWMDFVGKRFEEIQTYQNDLGRKLDAKFGEVDMSIQQGNESKGKELQEIRNVVEAEHAERLQEQENIYHRLHNNDIASQASLEEIQSLQDYVRNEHEERLKDPRNLATNQELLNSSVGLFSEYKAELDKERERIKWEQEQLTRKEAELEARIAAAEVNNRQLIEEINKSNKNRKGKFRENSADGSSGTDNPTEYSTDGDVKMREWYVPRYEEKVPMFDNKGVDLEGFREKCMRHFNRYPRDYEGDIKAQVSFIEDHLGGEVLRWYKVRERFKQRNDPDVELLFAHIHERFPQDNKGELHPVYYYSKKLSKAEINYSITEKELLAIKTAFVEWRHLLMGAKHKVVVYTDHRNLLYATKPQLLSARQARWQEILSGYNFEIIYRAGKNNGKADALSRRVDQHITEDDLTKSSIVRPDQLKGFDDDEDDCFAIIETGFVEDLKQSYKRDKLAREVLEDQDNPLSKNRNKNWMVVGDLVVSKENLEQVYVPQEL